jgi:hypothetical protein
MSAAVEASEKNEKVLIWLKTNATLWRPSAATQRTETAVTSLSLTLHPAFSSVNNTFFLFIARLPNASLAL